MFKTTHIIGFSVPIFNGERKIIDPYKPKSDRVDICVPTYGGLRRLGPLTRKEATEVLRDFKGPAWIAPHKLGNPSKK
ncbi:MAG: hypothetical protein KTR14_05415 [Vampirovibrio sp.]|nr:hypothetical protein [Vampirovibrio sp.]